MPVGVGDGDGVAVGVAAVDDAVGVGVGVEPHPSQNSIGSPPQPTRRSAPATIIDIPDHRRTRMAAGYREHVPDGQGYDATRAACCRWAVAR